jgi:hypothetical protein
LRATIKMTHYPTSTAGRLGFNSITFDLKLAS